MKDIFSAVTMVSYTRQFKRKNNQKASADLQNGAGADLQNGAGADLQNGAGADLQNGAGCCIYPCDVISSAHYSAVKLRTDSYQFWVAHLKPASNFSIVYKVCKKNAKISPLVYLLTGCMYDLPICFC